MTTKETQEAFQWTNVWNQWFATIAANLVMLGHGCIMGWVSPAIPRLTSDHTPLSSGPLSNEQVSWIGSINCIGALIGALSFGYITNLMGSKRSILFLTLPSIVFWLLIEFGNTYYHILIARFVGGWAGGGMQTSLILYVSEIANDNIRGRLGGLLLFLRNIGVLIAYILGAVVDYEYIPYVCVVIPFGFVIIFATLPNTPQFYIAKGDMNKAEYSVKCYKGYQGESRAEDDALYKEYEKLKTMANESKTEEKLQLSDFCNCLNLKLQILSIYPLYQVFQWYRNRADNSQITAAFTIISYAVTVFEKAGTSINPYASSIVLAVALILGSLATTYLADRLGRKLLNLISLMGSAIGLFATSLYHYLYMNGIDLSALAWMPVINISLVIFISSAGIMPLTFICSVENLPKKIRTFGMAIISFSISVVAFASVKFFPILVEELNLYGCLMIYGIGSLVGFVFILLFLDDTSGKSLDNVGAKEKTDIACNYV
ncbi:facilitated trehalose transporter Tret1-like [Sitodiplosis mosellana]|uniref:facilitated trehalose transporter Tret1-like n=1 Tax=Sitodiplosis mosellana TaxID=263140 RepID=UPI002443D1C4|nr:facilitated trehalose transporter Tret1-like [Sitodiplosis mosellana]